MTMGLDIFVAGFLLVSALQGNTEIVEIAYEPIFRVPSALEEKEMLKAIPGIVKDIGAPIGKAVSKTVIALDIGILAEDIGLELFDVQGDRQRVQLLVMDERATEWKRRIDTGPPLTNDEMRLLKEEIRVIMQKLGGGERSFVKNAFTQPGVMRIVGVGTSKHFGMKAIKSWFKGFGGRTKNVVFSGRVPPYAVRRVVQRAWKALEKRQLDAKKVIDALIIHIAGESFAVGVEHGRILTEVEKKKEFERQERNRARASWKEARFNLSIRLELPPLMPAPIAVPARVFVASDPVVRAASVDYQVSSSKNTYRVTEDYHPTTTESYREERFYPDSGRGRISQSHALEQAGSINMGGWGGF